MSETTHELKTWGPYFEYVARGIKKFEVRKNDRHFHVGEILWLREWLPGAQQYTGRECRVRVTYILDTADPFSYLALQPGYIVMSVDLIDESEGLERIPSWKG